MLTFYTSIFISIFTPLIFSSNTNELYEFPKMFFVYIFGTIFISMSLMKFIINDIKFKKVPLYLLIYLSFFILSVIFSSHLYTSVWGYYTRFNGGLVSVLVFFGIYYVSKNMFSKLHFEILFKFMCISLFIISIYAIAQHFGHIAIFWEDIALDRVFSTFGQANWLAQYLVFMLPFVLYNFNNSTKKSFVWAVLFILSFAALWFTFSLSGLLGFFVEFALFFVLFRNYYIKDRKLVLHTAYIFLVCLLITVWQPGLFKAKISDMFVDFKKAITSRILVYADNVPALSIPESLSSNRKHLLSDPGYIRTGLWRGSFNLIFSSPKTFLIGTGPETFPYAFQPFRPKELNYSSEWNFVFNKPHNYYLQIFSESGVLGLISYLVVCFVLYRKVSTKYKPGFIGFMITNFFGWPCVATSLLFWLLLAESEVANV